MVQQMGNRNVMLDAIRGVAIMIVVFAHALQGCYGMDWSHPLHRIIHLFQMPLLMAISGYAACYGRRSGFVRDISKKFKRLFVPSLVWSWISLILQLAICGELVTMKSWLLAPFFSSFWFLRVLFLIFFSYLSASYLVATICHRIPSVPNLD